MRSIQNALPLYEKLKRIQTELNNGEANEKVMQCYDQLQTIYFMMNRVNDALKASQQVISIYKSINGQDVADVTLAGHLSKLAMFHMKLNKYEDSLRVINEAEKMLKKCGPATDPTIQ